MIGYPKGWVLEEKVTTSYIDTIKDTYNSSGTSTKMSERDTREFLISIRLYQGSPLSCHEFALVINKLTKHIVIRSLIVCLLPT